MRAGCGPFLFAFVPTLASARGEAPGEIVLYACGGIADGGGAGGE
jgi:hypothetical protein